MDNISIQSLRCPSCGARATIHSEICEFCDTHLLINQRDNNSRSAPVLLAAETDTKIPIGLFERILILVFVIGDESSFKWRAFGSLVSAIWAFSVLAHKGGPFLVSLAGASIAMFAGFFWIQLLAAAFTLSILYSFYALLRG